MNELRVLTGLHRGIALPMDANRLQIGADFDSDLVLADQGIAHCHAVLSRNDRLPPNCWSLEIGDQNIWTLDNKRVSKGYIVQLDKAINVGGVWLVVMDCSASWPNEDIFRSRNSVRDGKNVKATSSLLTLKVAGLGVFLLLGSVALSFNSQDQSKGNSKIVESERTIQQNQSTELNDHLIEFNNNVELDRHLKAFEKMLRERDLLDLSVKKIEDGDGIEVGGQLDAESIAVLERMITRYRKEIPQNITVQNKVSLIQRELPFSVVKVISGPYGHIETEDGMRMTIGDRYKGFKLVSVDSSSLHFEGPTNLTVKW